MQTEYAYEPLGKTTASDAASANAFQFAGRENDGTGLAYYRARFLSPDLHRFVAEDPIEFQGGSVNLQTYAFSAPTLLIDPLGTIVMPHRLPAWCDPESSASRKFSLPLLLPDLRPFACDPNPDLGMPMPTPLAMAPVGPSLLPRLADRPIYADPLGLKPSPDFGGGGGGPSAPGGAGGPGGVDGPGDPKGGGPPRPGRGPGGDQWHGHNDRDFQDWFHKNWKEKGAPNATPEELDDARRQWEQERKPRRDPRGNWDRGKRQLQEISDWVGRHPNEIMITVGAVAVAGGIVIVTGGSGGAVIVVAAF